MDAGVALAWLNMRNTSSASVAAHASAEDDDEDSDEGDESAPALGDAEV